MTTLNVALPVSVSMKAAGIPARTVTLNEDAMVTLFQYGVTRWLNDRTGGANQTEAERAERADKAIEALLSGEVRSGGKRLDWFTKAAREIVRPYCVRAKMDKDEITRLIVKDPSEAFAAAIQLLMVEKYGKDVDPADVADKYQSNWAALLPGINSRAAALEEADRIAKTGKAESEIEI